MSWNLALRSFLSRIQEGSCHVEAMKLWKGHWPRQIQTKLQGINSRSITHQHSSEEVTKLSRIQIVFHLETCKVPLHFISQALQIWEVFLGFSLSASLIPSLWPLVYCIMHYLLLCLCWRIVRAMKVPCSEASCTVHLAPQNLAE